MSKGRVKISESVSKQRVEISECVSKGRVEISESVSVRYRVEAKFIPESTGKGRGKSVLVLVDDNEAVHLLHLVTQHVHQLLHELSVPLVLHSLSI